MLSSWAEIYLLQISVWSLSHSWVCLGPANSFHCLKASSLGWTQSKGAYTSGSVLFQSGNKSWTCTSIFMCMSTLKQTLELDIKTAIQNHWYQDSFWHTTEAMPVNHVHARLWTVGGRQGRWVEPIPVTRKLQKKGYFCVSEPWPSDEESVSLNESQTSSTSGKVTVSNTVPPCWLVKQTYKLNLKCQIFSPNYIFHFHVLLDSTIETAWKVDQVIYSSKVAKSS